MVGRGCLDPFDPASWLPLAPFPHTTNRTPYTAHYTPHTMHHAPCTAQPAPCLLCGPQVISGIQSASPPNKIAQPKPTVNFYTLRTTGVVYYYC